MIMYKYARICPLASRTLQKLTCIFKYVVFLLDIFVVLYCSRRKQAPGKQG